jgi:hypothetical protein
MAEVVHQQGEEEKPITFMHLKVKQLPIKKFN